jgi:flagellar operon protein
MADATINGVQVPFVPIGGVDSRIDRPGNMLAPERSFETLFRKELAAVRFSKHASDRIAERNMQIDGADLEKIDRAISRAEEKGSQDSLIFLRDMAFIVNVPNRTVVTAIESGRLQENVFTNIDSAVIAA